MKEMVFLGRGGEGVVLASQLLAETFARAGFWVQSFPEFKAERRGAPISAFLRWDDASPIHRRYRVRDCDVLVDVSPSEPSAQALASVRPGGLVVLNLGVRFAHAGAFDVARIPASRIARGLGILSSEGRPMGNTALLGACVKLLLPHGLELLEQAIAERMGANAAANVSAARAGYASVTRQRTLAADAPLDAVAAPSSRPLRSRFPVSSIDSRGNLTGGWSLERPLLGEACTACGVCALFCPEGAITRDDDHMAIDLRYCKGCGICEVVCPVRNALGMEAVPA